MRQPTRGTACSPSSTGTHDADLVKAVVLHETGTADRLELVETPDPEPAHGERVVEVRAAGVNYVDVLIRQGQYPQAPPLPTILGREVAGEVGSRRVIALIEQGGYAERVAASESWVFPLPERSTFEEGAAFLIAFLSAYIPLTRQARVTRGSTVLVHGAAGGVGSAAIQVARWLGARVVATAGSEERRAIAMGLGADAAYSYDEFADQVRADTVLDLVGGDVFTRSLRVLEPLGSLIAVGSPRGWWEQLDPAVLVGRNVSVVGFYLARLMQRQPEIVRQAAVELIRLWTAGEIAPVVGNCFPLTEAPASHRLIEERRQKGKVVLAP